MFVYAEEAPLHRPMALILDHINGVGTDNRLENLQIVCPNCAATHETHAVRKWLQCGIRDQIHVWTSGLCRIGADD